MSFHIFLLFNQCRLTLILQIRSAVVPLCLLHSLELVIFILLDCFSTTAREISLLCYLTNFWEKENDHCHSLFEDRQKVKAAV